MSKFLQNSSYSIANNFFNLICSFFSGMIIARILGPQGKGELYLINQIVSISSVFFAIGIGPAILYFLKKKEILRGQSLKIIVIYTLIVCGIVFLIYSLFSTNVLGLFNNTIDQKQFLFCCLLIVITLFLNFLGYVLMDQDTGVKIWSLLSIIGNIIYLSSLFTLVFFFEKGVYGALMALLLSALFKLILIIIKLSEEKLVFEDVPWVKIKPILKYSLGLFAGNLFLTGVYRIDVFFVNNYLSVSELGIYSVSVTISELLLLIPSAIGVALFPHLSALGCKEQVTTMGQVGRLSMILGILGTSGIAIFAYPLILLIFGGKFLSAFLPTLLLLPGLIAMTLNYAYSNYIFAIGKPFFSAFIFGGGLAINIVLNLFLLKYLGINGAALFSSITYIIITIGFIGIIKKETELPVKEFVIPTKQDIQFIKNYLKNSLRR